jgi:sporulation protein YlmC with PRC-barrel domain
MTQQPTQLVKTNDLIGKKLMSSQNEDLGTIHDLVLAQDYQQVSYAALARGGVLGMGSKLFAIPWTAVKVGTDGKPTANISKQTLDQATGFDDKNWPSQGDSRLLSAGAAGTTGTSSSATMGTTPSDRSTAGATASSADQSRYSTPSAGMSQDPNRTTTRDRTRNTVPNEDVSSERTSTSANKDIQSRRVSKLTGLSVRNPQNDDVGDIEEFVIDAPTGHVEYTVVSFGGFWGIGEKYVAIPTGAVDFQPQQGIARINADRQALESVAFDPGNWPDLMNREYSQRLHTTFKEDASRPALGYVAPGQPPQPSMNSQQAWSAQGEYAKNFDASKITTIKGTVQSVGTYEPARGVSEGLRLRVKTTDGKTITVHAGPMWYARQKNFYLKPGDEVNITGSNTKIGWRSVFVATEIQKGNETLQLRSKTGEPLWSAQGQQSQQRQPSTMDQQSQTGQSDQTGQAGQTSQRSRRNSTSPQ